MDRLDLELHPTFNIFVGANAQGKTNLLEAIYFLAFGRSFRLSDYRDLIQWKKKEGLIQGTLETDLGEEERRVTLSQERKEYLKNKKRTTPNQFRSMPLVLFAPEIILLLKDSPRVRREYIDSLFTKISPTYGPALKKYKRALAQRNRLIVEETLSWREKMEGMILWEASLIEHGRLLIEERREWLARLNHLQKENYISISGSLLKGAGFQYLPNVEPDFFQKSFQKRREEEVKRGMTLVGPHRDAIIPCLNGDPIKTSGSQGELRTFTLALKLSEIQIFREVLGRNPILLLDDFFSELDEHRGRHFLEYLEHFSGQIFATGTSLYPFPKAALARAQKWVVEEGSFSMIR